MNVLHIVPEMDPQKGGVGQAVRNINSGLSALGISNEIVSLDDPTSRLAGNSGSVHSVGLGRGPWHYNKQLIPHLIKNLPRFDAVIVHGLWLYHSYAIRQAMALIQRRQNGTKKISLPKLFVMPHGMLDPYFQKAPGRKLKAVRNWIYWKLVEKNLINEADGLLFTCEMERQLARKSFFPYHPKSEIVVGLGVEDPPRFDEKFRTAFLDRCPSMTNLSYILYLGRIDSKKGIDLLIAAYASLIAKSKLKIKFNTPLPKLVIAGPGLDTDHGRKIQEMVDENHLASEVYFTGMLTGDAKWGAYYCCESFILPSHQENFGIAVVEALACSKPVLISSQVNIWQEITNQGAGVIAEDTLKGTITMLTQWVHMSARDKDVMGNNARKCYENNFAIKPAAAHMLQVF